MSVVGRIGGADSHWWHMRGVLQRLEVLEISWNFIDLPRKFLYVMHSFWLTCMYFSCCLSFIKSVVSLGDER